MKQEQLTARQTQREAWAGNISQSRLPRIAFGIPLSAFSNDANGELGVKLACTEA